MTSASFNVDLQFLRRLGILLKVARRFGDDDDDHDDNDNNDEDTSTNQSVTYRCVKTKRIQVLFPKPLSPSVFMAVFVLVLSGLGWFASHLVALLRAPHRELELALELTLLLYVLCAEKSLRQLQLRRQL